MGGGEKKVKRQKRWTRKRIRPARQIGSASEQMDPSSIKVGS